MIDTISFLMRKLLPVQQAVVLCYETLTTLWKPLLPQNNTWVHVDMEIICERSTWYLNFCLHIMLQLTEVTL